MPEAPDSLPHHLAARVGDRVRRVGFLVRGEPYETGDVDEWVFARLCELTQNPVQPWAAGGVHECGLCRFATRGVATYRTFSVSSTSACVDLWIPGDGFLFACPTSVTHYIACHGYRPPADFCAAVLSSPPMRSVAHFKAILANGGRELGFGAVAK